MRIERMRAELSVQLVELELRMTRLMFVCAVLTVTIATLLALSTLRGPAFVLFLAGNAAQAYAVWRM
jgi:hypothetical protein